VPGHTLIGAVLAIALRVNLPIAIISAWFSNPVTIAPLFVLAYKTGAWLLNEPIRQIAFEFSFNWLGEQLLDIWPPFLLGCLVCGLLAAAIGYASVRLLWRLAVLVKWHKRLKSRQ